MCICLHRTNSIHSGATAELRARDREESWLDCSGAAGGDDSEEVNKRLASLFCCHCVCSSLLLLLSHWQRPSDGVGVCSRALFWLLHCTVQCTATTTYGSHCTANTQGKPYRKDQHTNLTMGDCTTILATSLSSKIHILRILTFTTAIRVFEIPQFLV